MALPKHTVTPRSTRNHSTNKRSLRSLMFKFKVKYPILHRHTRHHLLGIQKLPMFPIQPYRPTRTKHPHRYTCLNNISNNRQRSSSRVTRRRCLMKCRWVFQQRNVHHSLSILFSRLSHHQQRHPFRHLPFTVLCRIIHRPHRSTFRLTLRYVHRLSSLNRVHKRSARAFHQSLDFRQRYLPPMSSLMKSGVTNHSQGGCL